MTLPFFQTSAPATPAQAGGPPLAATTSTLSDLILAYSAEYLPHMSPQSRAHRAYFFTWAQAELGPIPLPELTRERLRPWVDSLLTRFKPGTVRTYLGLLNTVLNVGVKAYGWLDENPLTRVKFPASPPDRVRYLSEDEREALLEACQHSRQPALIVVVKMALATGMRKNEILSLHWAAVDFTRGLFQLQRTKNGESRAVPMAIGIKDLLKRWQKRRRFDVDLVFPRTDGTKPIYIDVCWVLAVKRAGLDNFRFHDLRHSAASYLAMTGASLREISEVLGHKHLAMSRRYAHLSDNYTAAIVQRMNTHFLGDAPAPTTRPEEGPSHV